MLSIASPSMLGFAGAAMRAPVQQRAAQPVMETVADLEALAKKLNPAVGYYNPTSLAEMEFWGQSQEATIGFLRQGEQLGALWNAALMKSCTVQCRR